MQQFKDHWQVKDKHATLAPSSYAWLNYTDEHMIERLTTMEAAKLGSQLHQLAHDLIKHGMRLEGNKTTMARYVRDCIGHRMTPELLLYFSENCFGTTDAISYRREKGDELFTLRIFDLKTGVSKASVNQLLIYCALFCLDYDIDPHSLKYDLRIYQKDDVQLFDVEPREIIDIIARIRHLDKLITARRLEEIL